MFKLVLHVVVFMTSVFSTQASKTTFIDADGNKVLVLSVVIFMAAIFSTQASKTTFIDADGNKVKTVDVAFDRADNQLWMVESNNAFVVQDFTKGIRVSGNSKEKICFITPFDTSENDEVADKSMVKDEVRITMKHNVFQILKGDISDTSFLPNETVRRCPEGFKWRIPVPHDHMAEKKDFWNDLWDWWVEVIEPCYCDTECTLFPPNCGLQCGC